MLIADGGGGYGGTDWMSKDVRFMWSTIANQETDPHFDVVGGWRKTADLTLAHLGQVQMYRDNLASVWPPAKSAAAAAYIARLDKLLVDLQATHDAASANYTAFSTVTLTLSLARGKLKPILDEYEANERLNLAWQAKQDTAAPPTPSPTPTPSPSPGPPPVSKNPPVSSARQEQLNNQARAIMYDLSSTVLSGQAALKTPKPYMPNEVGLGDDGQRNQIDGSTGGFAVPPAIPPPGGGTSGSSGSAFSPGSTSHITPTLPTTSTPAAPGPPNVGGGGPVLGGIGPTPVTNPPSTGVPIPGPTPPPPTPGIIGPPVTPPGFTPTSNLLPNGTKPPTGGQLKPSMGAGPAVRMAPPSGGVIGAAPGSGVIGQMPAGAPGSRPTSPGRASPVGGVIGPQSGTPAGGPRGVGMPQSTPMIGSQGRGRSQHQTVGKHDRWDPDNPWATAEGVAPVVLPPDDQGPIDPGPAIGYSK